MCSASTRPRRAATLRLSFLLVPPRQSRVLAFMFSGKLLVRKSSSESNAPIAVKSSSTVIVVLSYKGVKCVMWKWWGVHNATMCITRADKMSIMRTDKVSIIPKNLIPTSRLTWSHLPRAGNELLTVHHALQNCRDGDAPPNLDAIMRSDTLAPDRQIC